MATPAAQIATIIPPRSPIAKANRFASALDSKRRFSGTLTSTPLRLASGAPWKSGFPELVARRLRRQGSALLVRVTRWPWLAPFERLD